ncbi:hypothetical protein TeGR_g948 [Tetraparma gracilis]|uniref:Uncharacterized protein n=1 Tax=Tetraparma gracilis TaxID=2962635 RepID=A0ABQ6MHF4_9STRA|nr:hypothetical protein TeGR_g948 [Tetraparma gracilis]
MRGPSALAAKRGKGGLGSKGGSKPPNPGFSAPQPSGSSSKFFKTPALATSLPAEDGAVALLETMAPPLINAGTNPNGAIAVARFAGKLFAFQSGCETCQFPFKKAKLLPAAEDSGEDPRLACDFCGCTYNLRTGAPLKDAGVSGNVMGKMVRSTNTKGRSGVRVFELAEDDKGRVLLKL